MKLYVDLDGVLCDLQRAMAELMGTKLDRDKDWPDSRELWAKVDEAGEKFWAEIEWQPGGKRLWDALKSYKLTILSSPSRHESSKVGKRKWVRENLGSDVDVIIEPNKEKYASPDAILVDDRQKVLDKWTAAGGVGVLHTDTAKTIKRVAELMSSSKQAFKIKYVVDSTDPSRRIGLEKIRGGRREQVHQDDTKYDRPKEKRRWRGKSVEGSVRVVMAYLKKDETTHPMLLEIADDFKADVEKVKKVYEELKEKDPQGTERLNYQHRLEALFGDADYKIQLIRRGDRDEIARLDYDVGLMKRALKGHVPATKLAYDDFKFRSHPVIIDPYDAIVQQALQKMGPAGRNIDVVKLEVTCTGDKVAWVSNEDFFQGKEGKKRVVHLCLNKIKGDFKKAHGKAFNILNAQDAKKMREVVMSYLKDVVLPHESAHIEQEIKGKGKFGPTPEMGAEKAEDWSHMQELGIVKKAGFFPEDYDPEKGKYTTKMTPLRSEGPVRREAPFSFKRLRTQNLNYVRGALLGMKDPKATKIWDYIEAGLMGNYSREQEEELKKIVQQEAREYSLAVGELVNNLFGNKGVEELRLSPVHHGISRKFARSVVMKYASQVVQDTN